MIVIRAMKEQDVTAVSELERQCFTDAWSEQLLRDGLESSLDYFLVLEEDGQECRRGNLTGYANLRLIAGEGEIERIAVNPSNREKGFGRKLMEAMIKLAEEKDTEAITLEVRSSNAPAIHLYHAFGFKEEGCRKNYYQNPMDDALIMWRRKTELL